MRDLTGKVVWAIGSGTGIGASGAELLAADGARVILSGRRREPLEEMVTRIEEAGGEAYAESLDIADGEAVAALGAALIERFGRLDIMINSAAINVPNREAADAFADGEPLRKAGVFSSYTVTRMRRGQWNPDAAPKTAEGE